MQRMPHDKRRSPAKATASRRKDADRLPEVRRTPVAQRDRSGATGRSARFERFVNGFVLPHETVFRPRSKWGNYDFATWEDVSGDAGGVTKFGIDQRSHPTTDIKNLTLEQARAIYWLEYWLPAMAEHMPAGYGEVLADIRINGGKGPLMLQQALNRHGAGLAIDGRIGPKTMEAMRADGCIGLIAFLKVRQGRYDRLATEPRLAKFHDGWTQRNNDLADFVGVGTARAMAAKAIPLSVLSAMHVRAV